MAHQNNIEIVEDGIFLKVCHLLFVIYIYNKYSNLENDKQNIDKIRQRGYNISIGEK